MKLTLDLIKKAREYNLFLFVPCKDITAIVIGEFKQSLTPEKDGTIRDEAILETFTDTLYPDEQSQLAYLLKQKIIVEVANNFLSEINDDLYLTLREDEGAEVFDKEMSNDKYLLYYRVVDQTENDDYTQVYYKTFDNKIIDNIREFVKTTQMPTQGDVETVLTKLEKELNGI